MRDNKKGKLIGKSEAVIDPLECLLAFLPRAFESGFVLIKETSISGAIPRPRHMAWRETSIVLAMVPQTIFLLFTECFKVVPFIKDIMRKMDNKPSRKNLFFLRILFSLEFAFPFLRLTNSSHNILNYDS